MGGKRKRGTKEAANGSAATQKRSKSETKAPANSANPILEKRPFVETPIGDERKREAALYELLGSEDANERIEAADVIISGLLGGEGASEAVVQRHLDRRLFRGLASGRNASRLGFSLVITEILSQLFGKEDIARSRYPGLTFEKTLELLVEKTEPVGSIPGQEERDHFFGLLFGLECFLRSKILFDDISRWQTVLELLLKLGTKKVWLRSQCGWILVQALNQMSQKQVEGMLRTVTDSGMATTPEGIAIWLVALKRFPEINVKPWKNPLQKKSLGDVAAILKESFQDSSRSNGDKATTNSGQSTWTAQLHFVWDIILAHFAESQDDTPDEFEQFWFRVVDEGLFSKNATDGQKFKGFMVFQKILDGLSSEPEKIRCLFSKNLMLCLMNQALKEDRYLHRAAVKALKAIETTVLSHPSSLVPVLDSLLGKNGAYNFDQRTNSKTIDRLLTNINQSNQPQVMEVLRKPLASLSEKDASEAQLVVRTYVEYLSKALTAFGGATQNDRTVNSDSPQTQSFALQELSRLAYTQPKDIPEQFVTDKIKDLCRSRLESSLAKLTRKADDFGLFCNAVISISSNRIVMEEEIEAAMKAALARMHKLLKRKPSKEGGINPAQGLAMLHAVSIFQLYNEDPDAMEVLSDLAEYSERLKKGTKKGDDGGSSELLIEILLSMVARPSSLMRQASQQVFDAFTSQISAEGLALLTGPLASGESTQGQRELFNTEDDMELDEGDSSEEDDVEDVEDASDVEIDSDVEFVTLNGDEAEESEGDDEGDDDAEEEGQGEETEGQEAKDFEELLGKILKSHRLDKDDEADESASDGDMSDSEMMALDDKLGEVMKHHIKNRTDSSKQKKDAKQAVVNFKHRILDLLDIYVKNEPQNQLAFGLLVPLLQLVRTTSTKPLASRACEIILNYQKGLKKARATAGKDDEDDEPNAPSSEDLLSMLVEVHAEAGKDNAHAYAKAASAASLIVASTMYGLDKQTIKQVAAVYAKTQSDWVLGEAKLQSSFFADWNNWCQNHASQAHS
ncbi:DNA polymerase V [Paramyrothecium foliicola]|nr:DNA polymerase V [Paramyrothecium foliicola]